MLRIVISVVAIGLLALPAQAVAPSGFAVLGTTIPASAENIPIPPGFTEQAPNTNTTPPIYSQNDLDRGFVTFVTNVLTPIYPSTLPLQAELTDQVALSEIAGEYEPAVFSIHALNALIGVSASASNLVFNANTINAENIDIRTVRAMPRRVALVAQYVISPTLLEKRASVDIAQDTTQQYRVTVFVPPGTPVGTYTGTLTVSSQGNPDHQMDLTLEVLDIPLQPQGTLHGMYYMPRDLATGGAPTLPAARLNADMINMREHGMQTIFISWPPTSTSQMIGQKLVFDVSSQNDVRDACLTAGFDAVIFNTTIDELIAGVFFYRGMVRPYVEALQAAGWPVIIASYGDESDANGSYFSTYNNLGQLKDALPGTLTYATIVLPESSEDLEPFADCRAFSSFIDETAITNTAAAGRQLWEYSGSVGYGLAPIGERFYRGIWTVLFDFDGVLQWTYLNPRHDDTQPFNDLIPGAEQNNMTCYVFPGDDGPLNSPGWEAKREGIQDQRYAITLESLIAQALLYPSDAGLQTLAQNAQTFLNGVYGTVDLSPTLNPSVFTIRREVNKLAIDDLDNFRSGAGQHIQLLAAALTGIQPTNCVEVSNLQALFVTDLNGDCVIDFHDYALFIAQWMQCNIPGDPGCI
jgi:hypothetical protein